jgi:flagellar hook-associated protein 1 FlgK
VATNVLNTSISGLLAAQRSLAVTSQNIANVNTDGYSRQRVNLETRDPENLGFGFIGTGVTIAGIQRVYDDFNTQQLRLATSSSSQADKFHGLASQVDDLLGSTTTGVMPAVQDFFNALHDLSNDPGSQVNRQVLLTQANNLAEQFHYYSQQFDQMRRSANSELSATVDEVNSIASSIADMNRRITEVGITGGAPNDLLDKRDEMIRQLAERVGVTTTTQEDGSVNVFVGNGQALVVGTEARRLTTTTNLYDPGRLEVAYDVRPPIQISEQLTGGKVGGILAFRTQVLDPAQNALGQLAIGVASTVNAQHALGMDLNGDLGGDFFEPVDSSLDPPTVQVLGSSLNAGQPPAQLGAVISDAAALTASDYRLERNGSGYSLVRLSDSKTFALSGFPAGPVTVDGVTLSLDAGAIAVGDSFLIQPSRAGATAFGVAINDASRIAAAGPLRASAALANVGTGEIGEAVLFDRTAYTGQAYTVEAVDSDSDGAVDAYNVLDAASNVVTTGAYVSGADIAFDGIRVQLSGEPGVGDRFTVQPNLNGTADNRNALALAGLQTRALLGNGTATYEEMYGRLVGDVGNKTGQAQVTLDVQNSLLSRAQQTREAVSGVNLDEEAANILKFQQAYQAAAQLIATANTLFETLIGMVRS